MNEFWVPVAAFIAVAIVVSMLLYFRYKTKSAMQQTLRTALEKGQELTPEMIEKLGETKRPPRADLRLGLIWLAVGIATAAFGIILGEQDSVRPFLAIGTFPFLVGVAYLIMSRFSEREPAD